MKFQWIFTQFFVNIILTICHFRSVKRNLSCTCHKQDLVVLHCFPRKLHEFSKSDNQLRNLWKSTISCHQIGSGIIQIQAGNRKAAVKTAHVMLNLTWNIPYRHERSTKSKSTKAPTLSSKWFWKKIKLHHSNFEFIVLSQYNIAN